MVLFQELALIRSLPSQVRVLAYFPNLVLISAFLGLGVGSLLARRRSLMWMWPAVLLPLFGTAIWMSGVAFTADGVSEHLWLLYQDLGQGAPVVEGIRTPIIAIFLLNALSFVPLGQLLAHRIQRYKETSTALRGYAIDLGGSLLGVLAFSVVSFLGLPPVVWFGTFLAVGAILMLGRPRLLPLYAVSAILLVVLARTSDKADLYSPYYALDYRPEFGTEGFAVLTNGSLHQLAWSMKLDRPPLRNDHALHRAGLHAPYQFLQRDPGDVLVMGAGNGNDVSVALLEGASSVDAVEIDPLILKIGAEFHPDQPYQNPNVRAINTDARAYLNDADRQYDLVVFGTLDSMTRLSALSTVRLDNFVYTRESIRSAKELMKPGGGMILYFWVAKDHIRKNLEAILTDEFGAEPFVITSHYGMLNTIYMVGPAFDHMRTTPPEPGDGAPVLASLALTPPGASVDPNAGEPVAPTDDWPYLYMAGPGISGFYLSLMGVFLLIALVGVFSASPDLRKGALAGRADIEMFLYGVAFLLLETRFVTEMSLVWGATWLTSAVVFGAILAVVLLGTLLIESVRVPFKFAFGGLLLALVVTYLLPSSVLLDRSGATRLVLSVAYVGAPVLFASLCFALRFSARRDADLAFGWNLLGAVVGGLLEFFSMAVGFKALVLVAAGAYLGSLGFGIRFGAVLEEDAEGEASTHPEMAAVG